VDAPPSQDAANGAGPFVPWFRAAAPYIHAFRGRTFVVAFGGEVVADGGFVSLTHDLNLLAALGVRLVLVHGARPQIETRLKARRARMRYVRDMRVTDEQALADVKEASGRLRMEIEALLSMGLPNSPMANATIRVSGGNFVVAQPVGVVDGVDMLYTGEVRKVNAEAIRNRLDDGELVLLSSLGFSPTGEIFNLTVEDVACHVAHALAADKLVFLMDEPGVTDSTGALLRELTVSDAERVMGGRHAPRGDAGLYLPFAACACHGGVKRAHLISRHQDGALLLELFTHEGVGTMVTQDSLETVRTATVDDVGGVIGLIEPLEADGTLVKRSRELLEREIGHFTVLEHDGLIVGCAALYPFPEERAGELACLAVHAKYRGTGAGERLLRTIEGRARRARLERLFVLTTRTAHWFVEQGFTVQDVDSLPMERRRLYNYQRRSKVLGKEIR
jgi:amino-acid N-acetyltransferase